MAFCSTWTARWSIRSSSFPALTGDALMVEDSVYDLLAARAAGVDAAAALWGPFRREQLEEARPTYWLPDVSDLLAILKLDVEE